MEEREVKTGEGQPVNLKEKLCRGVLPAENEDEFKKVEKVLAPFLRSLKKRKRQRADVLPTVYEELYLKENPKVLLKRLETGFEDPLELRTLLNETAELLRVVTKSKSVNLYLTDYEHGQIVLCPKFYRNPRFEKRYAIETGTYVAPHVAFTKEYIISSDILGDVRFPEGIPDVASVKAVICLPILTNAEENCVGIIELYRECSDKAYDLVNLQICNALTAWMGIAVEQNSARLKIKKEIEIHRQISRLADLYFSKIIPFDKTVADLLNVIKTAVGAEKAAFYVFDEPIQLPVTESIFADAYEEGSEEFEDTVLYKKRIKAKFGTHHSGGVVGYAAQTGEVININDAYKDHRFDKKTDSPFYRTRSLAVFPVKSERGTLAVLKIVNNTNYPYFRQEDIDLVKSLLRFVNLVCGYYIQENLFRRTEMILEISDRLLILQSKPTSEDFHILKAFSQGDSPVPTGLFKFDWDVMFIEEDAHKYLLLMFLCPDLMDPIFDVQTLLDFLLRIKKSYRNVLFHNFEHALCVLHCAFNILLRNKEHFKPTEIVSILLAALCHDVDHSGLTNTFFGLQNDVIFTLYGESCGETHRYRLVSFLIQQTDLLMNLSTEDYNFISNNLKKLILGFDLTSHFECRRKIVSLMNKNSFQWGDPEHSLLCQNMILLCSDHAHSFKNFKIVKKVTLSFYKELYKQGDLEKSMGFTVMPIMDRNKIDSYPENEIIYLTIIVFPVVEILIRLFPNLSVLEDLLRCAWFRGLSEIPFRRPHQETVSSWYEILQYKDMSLWRLADALLKKRDRKDSYRLTPSSTISSFGSISEEKSIKF